MLIKDWSRHSNTLVILLLENKTGNNASSFLLLGISQIFSFDLHASGRLSPLRTGTWSVGRGSLRLCWEPSSWHSEKVDTKGQRLTSLLWIDFKHTLSPGSENLSEYCHFYQWHQQSWASACSFAQHISYVWLNDMRWQCREPRSLSGPLSSIDAPLPAAESLLISQLAALFLWLTVFRQWEVGPVSKVHGTKRQVWLLLPGTEQYSQHPPLRRWVSCQFLVNWNIPLSNFLLCCSLQLHCNPSYKCLSKHPGTSIIACTNSHWITWMK